MSYVVKGNPGPIQVGTFPKYDAETKTTTYRYEYRGIESAIRGLEFGLRDRGWSYQIDHDGPVWRLTTEEPIFDAQEDVDRWEIYTESTEKSLFELPRVAAVAGVFDSSAAASDSDSYKKTVETLVENPGTTFLADAGTERRIVTDSLVAHLRSGVTGWQLDLIVLRRTRRVERYNANNGIRLNLDTGLILYTTSQLNLPLDVAFALPSAPDDVIYGSETLAKWRWRRRSQRTEYIGNFAEHTIELVFAPWSVLSYSESSSDLSW